MNIYFR